MCFVCILTIGPEVIIMSLTVKVNDNKCIGCSICARICPTGTLAMDKQSKKAYTTTIQCDNLWGCLYACPVGALEITEVSFNEHNQEQQRSRQSYQ